MKKYPSFIRLFIAVFLMSVILMYFENSFDYKSLNFYFIILQSVITISFVVFMLKRYSKE